MPFDKGPDRPRILPRIVGVGALPGRSALPQASWDRFDQDLTLSGRLLDYAVALDSGPQIRLATGSKSSCVLGELTIPGIPGAAAKRTTQSNMLKPL